MKCINTSSTSNTFDPKLEREKFILRMKINLVVSLMVPNTFVVGEEYKEKLYEYLEKNGFRENMVLFTPELVKCITEFMIERKKRYDENHKNSIKSKNTGKKVNSEEKSKKMLRAPSAEKLLMNDKHKKKEENNSVGKNALVDNVMEKSASQPEMMGNHLVKKPEKSSCLSIDVVKKDLSEESSKTVYKPPCIKSLNEASKNKKYDSLVLGSKYKNTKISDESFYEYDDLDDDDDEDIY